MRRFFYIAVCCLFLSCCGKKTVSDHSVQTHSGGAANEDDRKKVPSFNPDSAYAFVERQVLFGPRVPNSEAHQKCRDYLAAELERFGAKIYIQEAVLTAYNGDQLKASNIIGSFNPDHTKRVLLFAHWDSRPYSDQDPDKNNHYKPVLGADDGASGVGVLLEIARLIGQHNLSIGVDIIFFDAEDYGTPDFLESPAHDSYCLGSQFWAKNPHIVNYRAEYGILLDMVGSKHATFYKEATSVKYAAPVVEKVWSTARNLGYGKFFINANGGGVTDDHQYVIAGRNIPCIDIINMNPETSHHFGAYWHTQDDTMDNIDRETLKAVGETVLNVIWQ